ncbi:MAG TPA: hypothetical protein VFK93_05220 [Candidatus Limnocylindria bacterium]|jgi:hypothetical protein|nr:hypothetical protein [Candidatus Limnocylindria bacterium]
MQQPHPDRTDELRRRLRAAAVGTLLPPDLLMPERGRRLAATAVVVAGPGDLTPYLDRLAAAEPDLAAWDGRVEALPADGSPRHRVAIVDRYGQVYEVTDADAAQQLPDAAALEEWFRFLATACPECGVLDDPVASGPVP